MTVAVTLQQPYASLVAHGVKQWLDFPHRVKVEPGETVLIHAGREAPGQLSRVGEWCAWQAIDGSWSMGNRLDPTRPHEWAPLTPLPLGAVVATARIGEPVPIVKPWPSGYEALPLISTWNGRLHWWPQQREAEPDRTKHVGPLISTDISDQLPYGDWTPGRWAVPLSDVRRLEEPVGEYEKPCGIGNQCWGEDCCPSPLHGGLVPVRGRGGLWRPDPALCEACGVTP